ncbi:MAG: hypothetical protein ABTS16_07665 [Candidatus Accumulibacter phosphatis]|jgi:hypothetical protein|nr:hypothetical protein [Candidatus Accumulibacter contiguus]
MFRVIASIIVITCIALVAYLSQSPVDHPNSSMTTSPPRQFND